MIPSPDNHLLNQPFPGIFIEPVNNVLTHHEQFALQDRGSDIHIQYPVPDIYLAGSYRYSPPHQCFPLRNEAHFLEFPVDIHFTKEIPDHFMNGLCIAFSHIQLLKKLSLPPAGETA